MGKFIVRNVDGCYIPHPDFVEFEKRGIIKLSINTDFATKFSASNNRALKPKGTTNLAFHFWNWVAVVIFLVSIYFSFTRSWYWFIIGFLVMRLVWKANKKGNAENLLDAATYDAVFYQNVMQMNGWTYLVHESNIQELDRYLSANSPQDFPIINI